MRHSVAPVKQRFRDGRYFRAEEDKETVPVPKSRVEKKVTIFLSTAPSARSSTPSAGVTQEIADYMALGHRDDIWSNDPVFRAHVRGEIRWALGLE